ncbi:MAG TPA: FAD-dependent oxidoreductase [Vicinamibacterales bacterium]|nr:FAD-dependent oxidoreductase [Vicinamibacterales bacterium]
MQPRDVSRFEAGSFDLLVIGGGIHGLSIAYEASSRGLRCALIEAGDFGSGISFNHQKTAHGGLRSLQSMRLGRAREAIRERRALARIAPWFVQPLPFIVGTYRSVAKGRLALRAGFKLDAWLGRERNAGLERELHLPPARLLSRGMTLKLFPGIRQQDLTGGAQWYDYQMVENDRLTFAFAAGADAHGAVLANYVEAIDAVREAGRVTGILARDRETGRQLTIRASVTVNAAGSRAGDVARMLGADQAVPLVAAMNLVTSVAPREVGLAAPTSAGRMLTLVPWKGRSIVGTAHADALATTETWASSADVDTFVKEANEAFPALKLTREQITLVHWGLVPAAVVPGKAPDLLGAPIVRDHAEDGVPGAMTVIGVKYTTARAVAERTVTVASSVLGRRIRSSRTAVTVLPGAGLADHEGLAIETARRSGLELSPAVLTRLSALYAQRSAEIIHLMTTRPELRLPLGSHPAATTAEVAHVVQHEMAVHLSDIIVRRLTLGATGHPGQDVLAACATAAARELGWSEEQQADEISAVEEIYRVP